MMDTMPPMLWPPRNAGSFLPPGACCRLLTTPCTAHSKLCLHQIQIVARCQACRMYQWPLIAATSLRENLCCTPAVIMHDAYWHVLPLPCKPT